MNRRGFTLIELAIALSIIVVLSSVLVLRVTGWTPRQSLQASARAAGNSIRTWRERAMTDERTYRLSFAGNGWTVTDGAGEIVGRGRLPADHAFDEASLSFDRRGVSASSGVTLRSAAGAIRIRPQSVLNEIDYSEAR